VEVRRFRQTLNLLSSQKEPWTSDVPWRDLLKQLDGLIPDKKDPIEIDELFKISELLMTHEFTSDLWSSMLWYRERRLRNGLRLNENDHLETLLESRPYVTTLYGNYLFLLLAALARKYADLRIDQIQNLWLVVKSWHLRKIGFYLRDIPDMSKPKFDVRAVWSNLCKRAIVLTQIPLPVQSSVRHGQLLVAPCGDGYEYWVFLEDQYDQNRLRSGLWIGMNPLDPSSSIRWSESNTSEIANHATTVEPDEFHSLMTCKMEGAEYVWFFAEEKWNMLGELTIIPRKRGAITSIRGLQVVPVTSSEIHEVPAGVNIPSDLSSRVERDLSEISQMHQHIISVDCHLGIDSEMYSIRFVSEGEELDTRFFEHTSDLLQVLRRPLVEGVPLQSTKNPSHYFTWDSYNDIKYAELQLLRPYVERKTPFVHIDVPLPFSCLDLIAQPSESVSIQVTHDSDACPVVDGSSDTHGICWKLILDDDYDDSYLFTLADRAVSDLDIVSLMRAGEVFLDGARYKIEIDFENNPATREGIVFRESKLIARHLGLKTVNPGVNQIMDEEKLNWTISRSGRVIEIPMNSDVTGERVDTLRVQIQEGDWDIEEVFEVAEETIDEFVEHHFSEYDKPGLRIANLESLLEDIRSNLLNIKLGEIESLPISEDSLSLRIDIYRLASSADPIYEVNLAETLYELAKFHLRNKDTNDAREVIDECIKVYESYYDTWKEDWVKDRLRTVRSLRTRIKNQT